MALFLFLEVVSQVVLRDQRLFPVILSQGGWWLNAKAEGCSAIWALDAEDYLDLYWAPEVLGTMATILVIHKESSGAQD